MGCDSCISTTRKTIKMKRKEQALTCKTSVPALYAVKAHILGRQLLFSCIFPRTNLGKVCSYYKKWNDI